MRLAQFGDLRDIAIDDAGEAALRSVARPAEIAAYTQDAVNAAVNRFAEPSIHCELLFARHPDTQHDHAFVVVPGGTRVPVMSLRSVEGVIQQQRCYVRKPGPRSEEPHEASEWRALLDRCVRAGRDDLLDAIRSIVQGNVGQAIEAPVEAHMGQFARESLARWQTLIDPLPPNEVARLRFGYREIAFEVRGIARAQNLAEVRRRLDAAGQIRHTGWPPFSYLNREPEIPRVVNGVVETWLGGRPNEMRDIPSRYDFWRASVGGLLYLLRGYEEDGQENFVPGTVFDVELPVWRVGEAVLFAGRYAREFGANPTIAISCRFTGLRNRTLVSLDNRRLILPGGTCFEPEVTVSAEARPSDIEDNLTEVLHTLLAPVYERFDFFQLPLALVQAEVARLRGGRI